MRDTPAEAPNEWLRAFAVIRRRWLIVLVCLVIPAVLAYAYSRTQPKKYQATATVLVSDPSETSALAGVGSVSTAFASNALGTDTNVASLTTIAHNTARALGRRVLPGSVMTSNDGASNLLTVTATEGNPILAADIANAYARQYIAFEIQINRAQIATEEADLRLDVRHRSATTGSAAVHSAAQSTAQLATLASLQNANMQVINAARPPSSPSSPKTNQLVAVGAGIGLLVGLLLAFGLGQLDRRLWSPGDVGEIFDRPIVGEIPRRLAAHRSSPNPGNLSAVAQESFAMLYANISHATDGNVSSVLVTSAAGGEGTSTVALNLAHSAARAGNNVLLIEADLRHPTVASQMGIETDADIGLVDVLARDAPLAAAVHTIPLEADDTVQPYADYMAEGERASAVHEVVWEAVNGPIPDGFAVTHRTEDEGDNRIANLQLVRADSVRTISSSTDLVRINGNRNGFNGGIARMDVVFAGRLDGSDDSARMNPYRLLASDEMRDLLLATARAYDLVVIDTPPMSVVSDAIPLMKSVSGVLVVSRVAQDTRDSARRLRDQLTNLGVRTLGVVVNGVRPANGRRIRKYAHVVRS